MQIIYENLHLKQIRLFRIFTEYAITNLEQKGIRFKSHNWMKIKKIKRESIEIL